MQDDNVLSALETDTVTSSLNPSGLKPKALKSVYIQAFLLEYDKKLGYCGESGVNSTQLLTHRRQRNLFAGQIN